MQTIGAIMLVILRTPLQASIETLREGITFHNSRPDDMRSHRWRLRKVTCKHPST